MPIDHISLIDAARRWRSPEHRDFAEKRLFEEIAGVGGDDISTVELVEHFALRDESSPNLLTLEVVLRSGIVLYIPCNL